MGTLSAWLSALTSSTLLKSLREAIGTTGAIPQLCPQKPEPCKGCSKHSDAVCGSCAWTSGCGNGKRTAQGGDFTETPALDGGASQARERETLAGATRLLEVGGHSTQGQQRRTRQKTAIKAKGEKHERKVAQVLEKGEAKQQGLLGKMQGWPACAGALQGGSREQPCWGT